MVAVRERGSVRPKASQNKTRTLFAYTQITAPFAGVITHRYADTGAMIQAGISSQTQTLPLVRLSQNSRLRLVIPRPSGVGSALAAISHSASVGSRRPAQRQYASASYQLTWSTG